MFAPRIGGLGVDIWTTAITIAVAIVDVVARETLLLAAIGFLIGGLDDLAVDGVFVAHKFWHGWARRRPILTLSELADRPLRGRMAVFVPAWDERGVIGAMLRHALGTIDHPDYAIYVGTYPNDRATIDAVAAVADQDHRVRLVVGAVPGPTTKAACLNTLWRALLRDEHAGGVRVRAVVLHDAEDVVHRAELRIFDALIDRYATVQLPVLPLVDRRSRMVAGHYCDEFAEAHGKQMVVRQALGAGLPLAGVGCAIARDALDRVAALRGGAPFDAHSLTEDYELGLHIAELGGRGCLARVPERRGGPVASVRAYFPATLDAAVRQKARWMLGIALAGWDRTGWSRPHQLGDHWMRMRDRRAPMVVVILCAAYLAIVFGALSVLGHGLSGGAPVGVGVVPAWLLMANGGWLAWRLTLRAVFTGAAYGVAEALWSVPRMIVGNLVSLLAARRAVIRYVAMLGGEPLRWDKTAHAFPVDPAQPGDLARPNDLAQPDDVAGDRAS